jgi:hypothetical protein
MWKTSKGNGSLFNYCFSEQFTYGLNFNRNLDRSLLRYLSIERIYKFCLAIAICINRIKMDMYNPEIICIFISKNTKSQAISVQNIHKSTDLITIFGGKNLILDRFKPLVTFFLASETFNKENVIKSL